MTLVDMGRPNQVGVALKAHGHTSAPQQGHPGAREPENQARPWGRRQAREHHGRCWHQQCLADNIQPLGIFLLGCPAWKLFPLGHLHRLSGTWQLAEAGSFPGGFLLLPCKLAGSSLSTRRGPFLWCLWGKEESAGTLGGLGELGSD